MIELKAGVIKTPHDEGMSFNRDSDHVAVTEGETEFYLKSEADKVIEELKHQRDGAFGLANSGLTLDDLSQMAKKETDRQKYKRCIAMAKQCKESLRLMRTYEVTDDYWNLEPGHDAEYFCKKGDFYSKWRKRWLKLAEKFKED